MYPVRLTGHSVVLREWRTDDVRDVLRIVGDDRVTVWLSFASKTLDDAEQMVSDTLGRATLRPRDEYYLAVARPSDDRLIGFARLALGGVQAGKLGYAIACDEWGNGFATDAVRTLVEFGFTELRLHRISAAIGPDNVASVAVAERLGFSREGRLRDHVHTNGAWRDSLLYSVLADEWSSAAATRTSTRYVP
jgi:RimJ/RimL family protein N-acetyltransferase